MAGQAACTAIVDLQAAGLRSQDSADRPPAGVLQAPASPGPPAKAVSTDAPDLHSTTGLRTFVPTASARAGEQAWQQ